MSRLRALFVTDRNDAPYRYRCVQACAQLRASGAIANVSRLDDARLPEVVAAYSVVVLFRLPWGPSVAGIVEAARRHGVPLVFDCDDLVFDPAAAPLLPFRGEYSASDWEQSYGAQLRGLRRTFDACEFFLGSTPALADWAEKLGKPARFHPNVVPDEYLKVASLVRRVRPRLRSCPTIGYFSGSNTHDRDFEAVARALRSVLASRPDARIVIVGHLHAQGALAGFERHVVRLPYVSFRALPWAYAACDVTIAPSIEVNAFVDGKSALKFFEPGVFGVPIVASPTREMRSSIEHGVTGWLAQDEDAWRACLIASLEPEANRKVGDAARLSVERDHTSRAVAGRLQALLASVAVRAVGREPPLLPFESEEYGGRCDLLSRTAARVRRARDITNVTRALREVVEGPSPEEAYQLVQSVLGGARSLKTSVVVLIAGSPDQSGWRAASQIEMDHSPLGESKLAGSDPYFVSPPTDLGRTPLRYAVTHMRAVCQRRTASAQLFWRTEARAGFSEHAGAHFEVSTDGSDTTYVVDLWRDRSAGFPRRAAGSVEFRLDPLDTPGSARVLMLALIPDDWRPDSNHPPTESEPSVLLEHRPRATLSRQTGELGAGQARWFHCSRDPEWLRALLRRQLLGSGCVVERLERSQQGARALVRRGSSPSERVDIVVPVYNAREQTLRCLRSVLSHARGDFRLVVIDDASTDPYLWPELERFARRKERVLLFRNPTNIGFVATCNRAFAASGGRDVLLLNSDTRVFRGFLGKLRACAHADERTGIVCPTSNNATICSVPELGRSNELPEGMTPKQMAALVRKTSRRRRPEIVTPVGFCMYVRAEVLEEIGPFDAERFGRGFGEENDFGERAKAAGWKIRLADDTWVWHEGKASFGAAGFELESSNARVLEARHPGYHAAVAQFIRDNPLAPMQDELRWQLARWPHAGKPALMMLLQASPLLEPCGGTEHVTRDLVQALHFPRVVLAWPAESGIQVAEVLQGDLKNARLHRFPLQHPAPRFCHDHREVRRTFREVLDLFRVGHVHVQHLMGWPLSLLQELRRAQVPYSMTVHDFYAICPSQNLLDFTTLRSCCPSECGAPNQVTRCMRGLFAELSLPVPTDAPAFVRAHRAAFADWFSGATRIFFPSPSARRLVESIHWLPSERAMVLPHAYAPAGGGVARPMANSEGKLRIALLGEVSYRSKGAEGYLELMHRLRDEPIEWHVFGATDRFDFERRLAALGRQVQVVRHGSYMRDEIVTLLRKAEVQLGVLLPIWPETFSLTLSELLAAGVPVIASRRGALEDRLDGAAHAVLVDTPEQAAVEIAELCHHPSRLSALQAALGRFEQPDEQAWAEAHARVYREHVIQREARPLSRSEIQRLCASCESIVPARPVISTTQPAARYRSARWYRRAEQLKPYLPESIRALARQQLTEQSLRVLQRFRLPSSRAKPAAEIRLDARYLSTARFISLGSDPSFVLSPAPVDPQDIGAIRFNLWCSHHGYTFAQVYWRHDGDSGFSEDKSLTIEVNGRIADWQEYVVRLDPKTHPTWYAQKKLVELRFDPVNYAGLFCVGRFELCAEPPSSRTAL